MKYRLSKKQMDIIRHLLMCHPSIDEAVLFGSRAVGDYKKASDIDIALIGNITDSTMSKVRYVLDGKTLIPLFFDLINFNKIKNRYLLDDIRKKSITSLNLGICTFKSFFSPA